jgi:PHP family Zn ribbon phosphoesterase
MQYVTDLHLHSKYSRAVSPIMTLPVMAEYAHQKGLDILSACDFTHPIWFKEVQSQLEEAEEGLYRNLQYLQTK